MIDSISRQAAVELIERMKPYHQDADDIAEVIANMPSAQPGCEDAVSREEIMKRYSSEELAHISRVSRKGLLDFVEQLPSVTPKQPGWIPCSEKEPTESGNYLLYRPHFWGAYKGQTTVCYWNGEFWSDDYCSEAERSLPVIEGMFWMSLPAKPYEGERDDNT